jgi:hypothetical protein
MQAVSGEVSCQAEKRGPDTDGKELKVTRPHAPARVAPARSRAYNRPLEGPHMTKTVLSCLLVVSLLLSAAPPTARAQGIPKPIQDALIRAGLGGSLAVAWDNIVYGIGAQLGVWAQGEAWQKFMAQGVAKALQNEWLAEIVAKCIDIEAGANKGPELLRALRSTSGWASRLKLVAKNPAPGAGGAVAAEVLLVAEVAIVVGSISYGLSTATIMEWGLDVQAADNAAFRTSLNRVALGMQSGKVKLLPGLTFDRAVDKIRENLEVGRAPYLNVLEIRPCPDIQGSWSGQLFVKEVKGQSNIAEGSSRNAVFALSHGEDTCTVTLKFGGNEMLCAFRPGETIPSSIGGRVERMEVDEVVCSESVTGTLSEARLKFYGMGSGSMQGMLDVEIQQRAASATNVSGGRMSRK